MEQSIDLIIKFATTFGIRVVTALIILFLGLQAARWVKKSVRSILGKTQKHILNTVLDQEDYNSGKMELISL